MFHFEIEQGTDEWHKLRIGKLTASRIADMMATTKSGWAASRKNYAAELVAERLTGERPTTFTSWEMQRGIDMEPKARAAYDFYIGEKVKQVGFVTHDGLVDAGASPDGLVGENGLVEIKCPNTATHIETLQGGTVSDRYIKQMQFQMDCTNTAWCDFVSYDDRLPESMSFFTQRITRDDKMIAEIREAAKVFLDEVAATVEKLREMYP